MRYEPGSFAGGTQEQMIAWLQEEFNKLREVVNQKLDEEVKFLAMPPLKVREGMIVAADGVNWNPGAGAGLYLFRDGSWWKLG